MYTLLFSRLKFRDDGDSFGEIVLSAKEKLSSRDTYIKLLFGFMLSILASVAAIMVGYLVLYALDIAGISLGEGWMTLIVFFVVIPIFCGYMRFAYETSRGREPSFLYCFSSFESGKTYLRTLGFVGWFIFKVASLLLGSILALGLSLKLSDYLKESVSEPVGVLVLVALIIAIAAAIVFCVFLSGRNFYTLALFVKHERMPLRQIRRISHKNTKGKLRTIWCYKLSYIGAAALSLLSVLVYFFLWTMPLATTAYFEAAEQFSDTENQ